MARTHLKKCLKSLVVREKQIKTTLRLSYACWGPAMVSCPLLSPSQGTQTPHTLDCMPLFGVGLHSFALWVWPRAIYELWRVESSFQGERNHWLVFKILWMASMCWDAFQESQVRGRVLLRKEEVAVVDLPRAMWPSSGTGYGGYWAPQTRSGKREPLLIKGVLHFDLSSGELSGHGRLWS